MKAAGAIRETSVYQRGPFTIGRYVWAAQDGTTKHSRIGGGHLLVLPWRAVHIAQEGRAPFIADPGSVVYYNDNQPYSAQQIDPQGEHSVYFQLDPHDVTRMVLGIDPSASDRDPHRPLDLTHARCSPASFLLHRLLLESAGRADADPIVVETLMAELVYALLIDGYHDRRRRAPGDGSLQLRHRREQAEQARVTILREYRHRLNLWEIARSAGVSSYHLCRIFRQHVGMSVHQYLTSIRLRAAVERVCDTSESLVSIALDLGFSSQAHFTTAFAREFGCTPGSFRRQVRSGPGASTILKDLPTHAH